MVTWGIGHMRLKTEHVFTKHRYGLLGSESSPLSPPHLWGPQYQGMHALGRRNSTSPLHMFTHMAMHVYKCAAKTVLDKYNTLQECLYINIHINQRGAASKVQEQRASVHQKGAKTTWYINKVV